MTHDTPTAQHAQTAIAAVQADAPAVDETIIRPILRKAMNDKVIDAWFHLTLDEFLDTAMDALRPYLRPQAADDIRSMLRKAMNDKVGEAWFHLPLGDFVDTTCATVRPYLRKRARNE